KKNDSSEIFAENEFIAIAYADDKEFREKAVFRDISILIGKYLQYSISQYTLIPEIKRHISLVDIKRANKNDPLLAGLAINELFYNKEEKAYYLPLYRNGVKAYYYKYYLEDKNTDADMTIPLGDGTNVYVKVMPLIQTNEDTAMSKTHNLADKDDKNISKVDDKFLGHSKTKPPAQRSDINASANVKEKEYEKDDRENLLWGPGTPHITQPPDDDANDDVDDYLNDENDPETHHAIPTIKILERIFEDTYADIRKYLNEVKKIGWAVDLESFWKVLLSRESTLRRLNSLLASDFKKYCIPGTAVASRYIALNNIIVELLRMLQALRDDASRFQTDVMNANFEFLLSEIYAYEKAPPKNEFNRARLEQMLTAFVQRFNPTTFRQAETVILELFKGETRSKLLEELAQSKAASDAIRKILRDGITLDNHLAIYEPVQTIEWFVKHFGKCSYLKGLHEDIDNIISHVDEAKTDYFSEGEAWGQIPLLAWLIDKIDESFPMPQKIKSWSQVFIEQALFWELAIILTPITGSLWASAITWSLFVASHYFRAKHMPQAPPWYKITVIALLNAVVMATPIFMSMPQSVAFFALTSWAHHALNISAELDGTIPYEKLRIRREELFREKYINSIKENLSRAQYLRMRAFIDFKEHYRQKHPYVSRDPKNAFGIFMDSSEYIVGPTVREWGLKEGAHIVDLGGGLGSFGFFMASVFGFRVTMVEWDPSKVSYAKEMLDELIKEGLIKPGSVTIKQGDFLKEDLGRYDAVYYFMGGAPDDVEYALVDKLKEIKTGGIFILQGHEGFRLFKEPISGFRHHRTKNELIHFFVQGENETTPYEKKRGERDKRAQHLKWLKLPAAFASGIILAIAILLPFGLLDTMKDCRYYAITPIEVRNLSEDLSRRAEAMEICHVTTNAVYVPMMSYKINSRDIPLYIDNVGTCAGLAIDDPQNGKHYLAHFTPACTIQEIQDSIAANFTEKMGLRIYILEGSYALEDNSGIFSPHWLRTVKNIYRALQNLGMIENVMLIKANNSHGSRLMIHNGQLLYPVQAEDPPELRQPEKPYRHTSAASRTMPVSTKWLVLVSILGVIINNASSKNQNTDLSHKDKKNSIENDKAQLNDNQDEILAEVTIDSNNRVAIPARLASQFKAPFYLFCKSYDRCIIVYPAGQFLQKIKPLLGKSITDTKNNEMLTVIGSNSEFIANLQKGNRLMIPTRMLAAIGAAGRDKLLIVRKNGNLELRPSATKQDSAAQQTTDPAIARDLERPQEAKPTGWSGIRDAEPSSSISGSFTAASVKSVTGKNVIDINIGNVDKIIEAIKNGNAVALNLAYLAEKESAYDDLYDAIMKLSGKLDDAFTDGKSMTPIAEAIKNAFSHGNRADFSKPIFLDIKIDSLAKNTTVDIYDTASRNDNTESRTKAFHAGLWGGGAGLKTIEHCLGAENFHMENVPAIGTRTSLILHYVKSSFSLIDTQSAIPYLEDAATTYIEDYLKDYLPRGARVLDLMSGAFTYVPQSVNASEIIGIGLNRDELNVNAKLTQRIVQDLNANPEFPAEWENHFDAVIITSGMAYV
ncbi:MAG: hypothetical protein NC933_04630, partial [Candidatus Omnitrophica bacterium]|nr:hypothetical protein [Candidatus Omnitrophota bacterium]